MQPKHNATINVNPYTNCVQRMKEVHKEQLNNVVSLQNITLYIHVTKPIKTVEKQHQETTI